MKKAKFFKSKEGEMAIAGLVVLCALPIILLSINKDIPQLNYAGLLMIISGMAFSPLRSFAFKRKEK
ncbi:MAG: hypothetical protein RSA62_03500 [Oscillospiraceae bacterium]